MDDESDIEQSLQADILAATLLDRGAFILGTLLHAGIDLTEPTTLLALQLIGPVLVRAIGGDLEADTKIVIEIANHVDLQQFQKLLKEMATR